MVHKGSRLKILSALLLGLVCGFVVSALVAILTATMVSAEKIQEGAIGTGAMIAILLGAMTTALVTVGKVKEMRLVMCLAAGAVFLLGLMCCAAIAFDGVKGGFGATAIVTFGAALVVFLIGMNQGKRPKYKVPKQRI